MATIQNIIATAHSTLGGTTDTFTYPGAAVAGDILYGFVRMGSAATLNAVTDSVNGGAWTIVGPTDNGGGRQYVIYFINSGAGTPTVTYTYSAASQAPRLILGMIRGAGTGAIVGTGGTSGTGTALVSGGITTTGHPNTIVVGGFGNGGAGTFSQNGGWVIDVVDPAAATSRIAAVHQSFTSVGTYTAAVDQSGSNAWIGVSAAFDVPSSGLNTGTQTDSEGFRDTNVTSKTSFNFNADGLGLRDTQTTGRTIGSAPATTSTGLRATNSSSLLGPSIPNAARFGLRDTQVTGKTSTNTSADSLGLRDSGAASKITFNFNVDGFGLRATNSSSLSSGQTASFGLRATNVTFMTRVVTNQASLGLRDVNVTSRAIAVGAQSARLGLRDTNIATTGSTPTPPTPTVVSNAIDCEPDWALADKVVWAST